MSFCPADYIIDDKLQNCLKVVRNFYKRHYGEETYSVDEAIIFRHLDEYTLCSLLMVAANNKSGNSNLLAVFVGRSVINTIRFDTIRKFENDIRSIQSNLPSIYADEFEEIDINEEEEDIEEIQSIISTT